MFRNRKNQQAPDLAAWLQVVHPAYNHYVAGLALVGTLISGLVYLDLQVLSRLVESMLTPPQIAGQGDRLIGWIVGLVGADSGLAITLAILGVYCLILLLRAAGGFWRERLLGKLEITSKSDIEREVLTNLLRKDDQFFQHHSASEVTNRLAVDIGHVLERRRNYAEIWFAFVSIVGSLYFFIQQDVVLTIIGFGSIVLGVGSTNYLLRAMPRIHGTQLQTDDAVKSAFEDYLATSPEVQIGNYYNSIVGKFERIQGPRRAIFLQLVTLNGKLSMTYGLSYMISFLAFVLTILVLVARAGSSAGELVRIIPVVIRALPEVYGNISDVARLVMRIRLAAPSVSRLLEYQAPPYREGDAALPGNDVDRGRTVAISLKNVSYRFSPEGPLQGGKEGISVEIPCRSLVAIVGGSGSGKSMLSQLILGRLQPETGTIDYGGTDGADLTSQRRAQLLAYMPQASVLLDATIEENLSFGQDDPTDGDAAHKRADMKVLARVGVARVALAKALEMLPTEDMAHQVTEDAIRKLRARLQEIVADHLNVEIIRLGPERAAPHHPVINHLLGGTVEQQSLLSLTRSRSEKPRFERLADTDFGASVIEFASRILSSTGELLSRCEGVDAYNRVAPYSLDPRVWELRQRLASVPSTARLAGPIRLPLLAIGLLASPTELGPDENASSLSAFLGAPDQTFVQSLRQLLTATIESFDDARINLRLSWRDNLLFGAPSSLNSRVQAEVDRLILDEISNTPFNDLLTACGFSYRVGRHGKKLSGGQRQMICLGRNLLRKARVYVLDEPTSALDPRSRGRVGDYLKERAETSTILVITHDMELARQADQILMMKDGNVHASGSFQQLLEEDQEFGQIIGRQQGR